MTRRFRMRFGGVVAEAELLEEKAPRICEAFWSILPFEAFSVHAKFAGQELIVMVPLLEGPENEMFQVRAGDIGYYPGRQTACIFYGEVTPFGVVSVFARIVENLGALRDVGARVLAEGSLPLLLERVGGGGDSLRALPGGHPLVQRLSSFLEGAWQREPADLARLRDTRRPPMGNLPCVFYANFDLFWASENLQVYRALAQEGRIPLFVLNTMTAALLSRTAARLSKWNMTDTVELLRDVCRFLEGSGCADAAQYLALTGHLMVALNRVQSWVDRAIPWSSLDESNALWGANLKSAMGR